MSHLMFPDSVGVVNYLEVVGGHLRTSFDMSHVWTPVHGTGIATEDVKTAVTLQLPEMITWIIQRPLSSDNCSQNISTFL